MLKNHYNFNQFDFKSDHIFILKKKLIMNTLKIVN